jgi:hypothetical protein
MTGFITIVAVEQTSLLRILEVLDSNLGLKTRHTDRGFCRFSQSLQEIDINMNTLGRAAQNFALSDLKFDKIFA